MPQKDGTGPNGMGPKTGRGQGNCGGKTNTTDNAERLRLGLKNSGGRGQGRGNGLGQRRPGRIQAK